MLPKKFPSPPLVNVAATKRSEVFAIAPSTFIFAGLDGGGSHLDDNVDPVRLSLSATLFSHEIIFFS
jgi:hypothetical protein